MTFISSVFNDIQNSEPVKRASEWASSLFQEAAKLYPNVETVSEAADGAINQVADSFAKTADSIWQRISWQAIAATVLTITGASLFISGLCTFGLGLILSGLIFAAIGVGLGTYVHYSGNEGL